jgi:hypothetical protein
MRLALAAAKGKLTCCSKEPMLVSSCALLAMAGPSCAAKNECASVCILPHMVLTHD